MTLNPHIWRKCAQAQRNFKAAFFSSRKNTKNWRRSRYWSRQYNHLAMKLLVLPP